MQPVLERRKIAAERWVRHAIRKHEEMGSLAQMNSSYRIAIVGAASLRGKELKEVLADSSFAASEFILMDDQEAVGQLEAAGDEVTFIQPISSASFDRVDFAFFAGHPDITRKHWRSALSAGASVLDLSYALEEEPGVLIRAPWVSCGSLRADRSGAPAAGSSRRSAIQPAASSPDLRTPAVVPAHPASVVLALLAENLNHAATVRGISATLLEPASEYGRAAMDELHRQTVALLSFESLPKSVYDIQVAFNAVAGVGGESEINLERVESRILRHYRILSGGRLPALLLQLIHLPVFHGHGFSIAVEFDAPVAKEAVSEALASEHIEIVSEGAEGPSNLTSAGQDKILLRIRHGGELRGKGNPPSSTFWLWAAADNLKLAVANAIACAEEMRALRPHGKVQ